MQRIFAAILTFALASTGARAEKPLGPAEAMAICHRVAQSLATENFGKATQAFHEATPELKDKLRQYGWDDPRGTYAVMDVDGHERIFDNSRSEGTCGGSDIYQVRMVGSGQTTSQVMEENDTPLSEDDDLRWATWGKGSMLLAIKGRAVVLAGDSAVYVGQGDRLAPICTLEAPTSKTILTQGSGGLCKAAVTRSLKILGLIQFDPDRKDYEGWGIKSDGAAFANLDVGGKRHYVAFFHYDSGAGCGSSEEYLAETDQQGRVLDTKLTRSLLSVPMTKEHPSYAQSFDEQSIGQFQGHAVIVRREGQDTTFYRLTSDKMLPACKVHDIPQPVIKRLYIK